MVIQIAEWSVRSLHLTTMVNGIDLATATGFLVVKDDRLHLVTNWHVLSGRNPDTMEPMSRTAATPDAVRIRHHAGELGQWVEKTEPLLDADGQPRWFVHPDFTHQVDIGVLPCLDVDGVAWYTYDPRNINEAVFISVAERVSVIGFPFGTTVAGGFPVWTQGFVASEPGLDFGELPCLLVDSRTRGGQSGSPVIFYSASGMYPSGLGVTTLGNSQTAARFIGVYSGRINQESDIGRVWKPEALQQILDLGVRATAI